MSLVNLIRNKKRKSFQNGLFSEIIDTKISDNWQNAQKYFDNVDFLEQFKIVSNFNNESNFNKGFSLEDIKLYFNAVNFDIKAEIFIDYIKTYKNQDWIDVEDFICEFKEYVLSKDRSEATSEEYLQLIHTIDSIYIEKGLVEDYLYSNVVVRYLRNCTLTKPIVIIDNHKNVPSWFLTHMYLDLILTIKKYVNNNAHKSFVINYLFNIILNEKERYFGFAPFLN